MHLQLLGGPLGVDIHHLVLLRGGVDHAAELFEVQNRIRLELLFLLGE